VVLAWNALTKIKLIRELAFLLTSCILLRSVFYTY